MDIVQAVTLAIAVLGAVLGMINTWQALDKSRVKLRVKPMHAVPVGGLRTNLAFCIEVTDLSSFALTVSEVGFRYAGTNQRGAYIGPVFLDHGDWPRRLEARSSVTVYGGAPMPLDGHMVKDAYAITQCGVTRVGSTAALKQFSSGNV